MKVFFDDVASISCSHDLTGRVRDEVGTVINNPCQYANWYPSQISPETEYHYH